MVWKGIVGMHFTPSEFERYVGRLVFSRWRPQFVVVHNTGAPTLAQRPHGLTEQHIQNLVSYYRDTMKWSAGPHVFVDQNGMWVFTPLTTPGVHSPSWNAVTWGVETLGDYETEHYADPIRANLVACLASLHAAAGLDSHTLRFHREDPLTTHRDCPGRGIDKADLIAAVHGAIAARHPGEHLAAV